MQTKQTPLSPGPAGRSYGIDALRVLAMLGIILAHLYSRGRVSTQLDGVRTLRGAVSLPLFSLGFVGLDLYAMISGFVLVRRRVRFARLLELWLQVVFTGLLACLLAGPLLGQSPAPIHWLQALLPVSTREYWYFSCYAAIYCLLPLLNRGLLALPRRALLALLGVLFGIVVLGGFFGRLLGLDAYSSLMGYSAFWLLVMYLFGAGLQLTGLLSRAPAWRLWLCVLVCLGLNSALAALLDQGALPALIRGSELFDAERWRGLVLDLQNPLLLAAALCLLALFARFRPGKRLTALIRLLSPLSFGVYLFHVHDLVFTAATGKFAWIGTLRALLIVPVLLGVSLAIYLGFAGLEWLRAALFRLLRVSERCETLENRLRERLRGPEKE